MSYAHVDNDDEYGEDDDDLYPAGWHYSSYPPLKYNWETHLWECGCSTFAYAGRCKHEIRLRREELVEVSERFL